MRRRRSSMVPLAARYLDNHAGVDRSPFVPSSTDEPSVGHPYAVTCRIESRQRVALVDLPRHVRNRGPRTGGGVLENVAAVDRAQGDVCGACALGLGLANAV